jgi:serine/threonine protein kinase
MALRPAEGVEPITGYRLIHRLGTGGYGEVWKATAPGGLTKAIKIIYGHLRDARAEQELRAMNRMKEVRHPFLLSLERVEISDEQLFIVTELADSSLMDRFEECRKAGSAGVPRDELIGYVRDAADALDYMNDHYALQHLDIKPQNLLLVGGRIKIADFGLVKDLHGTSTTATGGVTPIYASPEAFDGKVSRFSDQYSLAVVYQEMLTGIRPFPGKSALQLAAQHMNSPPLLDPLPPNDRAAIGRALSKVPEQRFGSCREMIEALQRPAASSKVALWQNPPAPMPAERPSRIQPAPISGEAADEEGEDLLSLETIVGFQAPRSGTRTPPREPATQSRTSTVRARRTSNVRLRPALFLGLGGLAGLTLHRLRQRLREHFGALGDVPIFRFLQVDTDRGGFRPSQHGPPDIELDSSETLLLPLRRAEHYRGEAKDLLRWLDRRWLYGIPRSLLTEGLRPLGRLALIDNAADLAGKLHETLQGITSPEAKAKTAEVTGLNLREGVPRIFLLAGIGGGTGSGMVLDTAYAVRQALHELHLSSEGLCAILLQASGDRPGEHELARVNSYATLTELNHFCTRPYPGDPQHGLRQFDSGEAPFQDCYIVRLGEQLSQNDMESATDALAAYLYLDTATAAGAFFDQYRQSTSDSESSPMDGPTLRTLGVHQLAFPRHAIASLLVPALCRQLIDTWLKVPAGDEIQQIESETSACASEIGLEAETMMDRLDAAVRAHWDEDADKFLQRNLTDWIHDAAVGSPEKSVEVLASDVIPKIEKLLGNGIPVGPEPDSGTPLEMRVGDEARQLGDRIGRATVDWLTSRLNDSRGQVGAAAVVVRYLQRQLTSLIESARYLRDDGYRNRMSLCRQAKIGDASGHGGNRWLGRPRRPDLEAQLQAHLLTICRLRLKEVLLENALNAFRHVNDRLSKFAQQMALVRDRLQHLAGRFTALEASRRAGVETGSVPPSVTIVFPQGTDTVLSAAESIHMNHGTQLLASFQDQVHQQLLKVEGGLWNILTRNADDFAGLYDRLQTPARREVLSAMSHINAAKLFMERHPEPEQAEHALADHIRSASPRLAINGSWSHLVVASPGGDGDSPLAESISKVCAQEPVTVLECESDVFFCFEATHFSVRAVAGELALEGSQFFDAVGRVMTRTDVAWASLGCEDRSAVTCSS